MRSQPNSPGFEVALGSHWGGFGVPIGWLSVGFEVALGWLWTPEYMPSICLLYGFGVAWGGFAPPFEIGCWMFDVGCPMFRTANRPGSQRVGMGLGVGPSGAFLPSWPLRTGTVRGPIQSLMQPCPATSQAGIRLVFPRRVKIGRAH